MRKRQPIRLLLVGLLLISIAAMLQTIFLFSLGRSIEWVFAALLALTFFADIGVYIVLLLFALWTMHFSFVISAELVLIAAISLIVYAARKFLPGHVWLAAGVAAFFAVIFFYTILLGQSMLALAASLILIALETGLTAAFLAGMLSLWYVPRR